MGRKINDDGGKVSSRITETEHFFKREFDIDIEAEYDRLKKIGAIPAPELKDKDVLTRHINQAARNAHKANMIYLKARKEREIFRIKFDGGLRGLTRIAIARIQAWFERTNNVKKQITKDMIREEICAKDDTREKYEALIREQEEVKEIRDNLENLARQWANRSSLLQTQASLLKYEKTVIIGSKND